MDFDTFKISTIPNPQALLQVHQSLQTLQRYPNYYLDQYYQQKNYQLEIMDENDNKPSKG